MALARALVNRPAVLLLDEPLGALDLKLRKGLQVELKRIQREVGITFVYVTHDQEEALTMSDRIAVMNHGVVEQVDAARGGLRAPAHRVRRRLHRRLEPDAGRGRVGERRPGAKLQPRQRRRRCGRRRDGFAPGERCHAVVRPEKLQIALAEEPAPDGRPSVEGIVESSPSTSAPRPRWSCSWPATCAMTVLVPNADEAERQRLPGAGATVRLAWAPEHMHVVRDGRGQARPSRTSTGGDGPPASSEA